MQQWDVDEAVKELGTDRITVGLATCGISAGAQPVYDKLSDAKLTIPVEKVGCIGMCYNEPIVTVVQDGTKSIYGPVTSQNVEELITCIKEGKRYEELFLGSEIDSIDYYKKQRRVIMDNCGIINPDKLAQYVARGGYQGLLRALKLDRFDVIDEVDKSGLRGRGGGGFPTARKWKFIAGAQGKKYLICNGDEGDPGAFMNRTLMESDPFRVIEGMTIGAFATGADEGIIYTRAEYPLAIHTLQKAIDVAYQKGLLGKNILGKLGFSFDVRIMKGAGAFVCGEETALIHSVEGKRGMPTPRPPYPAVKGLLKKPTVVNNVGTWGHVATLMRMGATEYRKVGTKLTKGTKVICLAGNIKRTGIVEVPIGITLRELIFDIGGGTSTGKPFKACLTGGPGGGCIPEAHLDTELDYEPLKALGTIMGSGGFVVLDQNTCMVEVARYFMEFAQSESCGKCTPCREGTKRLLEMLTKITRGVGTPEDLDKIELLADFVQNNALCGLGMFSPNPILSTLRFFKDEYLMHLEKKCPAGNCPNLTKYTISKTCVGCGNCARNCPVDAISGEPKQRYVIDQEKCIKCGKCYEVCAFDAVERGA